MAFDAWSVSSVEEIFENLPPELGDDTKRAYHWAAGWQARTMAQPGPVFDIWTRAAEILLEKKVKETATIKQAGDAEISRLVAEAEISAQRHFALANVSPWAVEQSLPPQSQQKPSSAVKTNASILLSSKSPAGAPAPSPSSPLTSPVPQRSPLLWLPPPGLSTWRPPPGPPPGLLKAPQDSSLYSSSRVPSPPRSSPPASSKLTWAFVEPKREPESKTDTSTGTENKPQEEPQP